MTRHGATSEQDGSAEDGAAHWLARLHADDCDGEDLRRFVAWRESDPANSAAYDRYQRQWDRLGAMGSAPGIVDLRLKALSMEPASRRFDWRQLGAIAAVLVVALAGIVSLVLVPGSGQLDPGSTPPVVIADAGHPATEGPAGRELHYANSYSTGVGQRTTVRLVDGSTVDLNTNSLVEVDFSPGVRRLNLLRGEAMFHVAKDQDRPFVVQTGHEQVTALGTVFMVRRDDDRTLVVLLEGKVKVDQLPDDDEGSKPVPIAQLVPGQQLALANDDSFKLSRANLATVASWRDGRLSFDNDRLSDVVSEVNRYSDHKLVIGDAAAGRMRISGTFRTGSADGFARLLTQSFPVEVVPDKASNDLIVKSRAAAAAPGGA